jgi:hypothetical protein
MKTVIKKNKKHILLLSFGDAAENDSSSVPLDQAFSNFSAGIPP